MSVSSRNRTVGGVRLRLSKLLATVVVLTLVAGACTRSNNEGKTGVPSTEQASGGSGTGENTVAGAGNFGDLKGVCGPGDATGATDQGVTDKSIQVGTISDPGFAGRPGLNQELFDATKVFVDWCNAAGGINGRKIKSVERDAKLTEYQQRVTESCQSDFMLVGGGGVLDDSGQDTRLKCMLPDIPAYQVTSKARGSDLSVAPLPVALGELDVSPMRYVAKGYPGSTDRVGFLTGNLGSLILVDQQAQDAAGQLGWKSVYKAQYNVTGESSWTPFAQAMASAKVRGFVYTGEPENLAKLLQAMKDISYQPDWVIASTNMIDKSFIDVGGDAIRHVYVSTAVVPPFMADKNPATQQYLDLFKKYLPKGKSQALLGYNSFSAWLLFATAAKKCGSDVTRKCVFDAAKSITAWTGGGLHAESNPGEGTGPRCSIVLEGTPKGFVVPDDFKPNKGLFQCSDDNVIELKGNYGKPATLASVGKSMDDLK